MRSYYRK